MCWIRLQGFLNVNKPPGLTSFDVIRQIKKQLPRKCKIGHLGTLDPMATGVLPIAIGKATRVIEYAADSKAYTAAFILGGVSDTQDAWGQITIWQENVVVDENKILETLSQFVGDIEQIPPMYSAVHHKGQRLYELARQGVEVERNSRPVNIKAIELLEIERIEGLTQVLINVVCSRGTYIRTLVHDIGIKLGMGAYLNRLTRVQSGDFNLNEAVMLHELVNTEDISQYLLAIDYPLRNMAALELDEDQNQHVNQGQGITTGAFMHQQRVRLYYKQQLTAIAYYDAEAGILRPEKVFV